MNGRRALPLLAAGVLLFLPARRLDAGYAYARALGTRCSSCHDTHRPDIQNLNAAGRYYLTNKTLDGFSTAGTNGPTRASREAQQPAPQPAPSADAASPAASASPRPRSGQPSFMRNCAPCHGAKGEGTTKARPLLPAQRAVTDVEIEKVIRDGVLGTGMFGFGETLKPAEIQALVAYVKALRGKP